MYSRLSLGHYTLKRSTMQLINKLFDLLILIINDRHIAYVLKVKLEPMCKHTPNQIYYMPANIGKEL